jgi:hypothetical protein
MAVSFQQIDTGNACGIATYCSANTKTASTRNNQAVIGGTAGSIQQTFNIDASAVHLDGVWWELTSLAGLDGASGNWTFRLHVTTANANLTWAGVTLCRVNASCVNQASVVATNNGFSQNMGAVGTLVITTSGVQSIPASGDKLICIYAFNNSAASLQSWGYTPDVKIDSPWSTIVPADEGYGPLAYSPLIAPTIVSVWG